MKTLPSRFGRRGSVAFEIALVLAVVVAATVLATSVVRRVRQHARVDRFVVELRARSAALESFRGKAGRWPAAAWEGAVPAGLEPFLGNLNWPAPSAIGGRFVWTPPVAAEPGRLSLTAFDSDAPLTTTRADLRAIDAIVDDGDLATGRFRTGFNDWPVWRVGP